MQKLAGGNSLACGHKQVISNFRFAAQQAGIEQRPVWCIECNDWARIIPAEIPSTEPEETVDTSDDDVLELP